MTKDLAGSPLSGEGCESVISGISGILTSMLYYLEMLDHENYSNSLNFNVPPHAVR